LVVSLIIIYPIYKMTMIKEIERAINKYFPSNWNLNNTKFFLGRNVFDIDNKAIDNNLNAPIRDFLLRGGKRWRPVFFLTSLKLFGLDYKKYIDFASTIELIHNATLIIDDIEDDAELRRGKPVCHKIFGIDTAVNSGIALHFLAGKIFLKRSDLTEEQRLKIMQIYNEEITNVYFGQTIDIYWHKNPKRISVNEYLEMSRLKTGGLIRMSARIACVLARKDRAFEEKFIKFSEMIGIAFQIKDDSLDFVSDKKFGKSFGNDVTEGKLSLPILFAFENLTQHEGRMLWEILRKHTHSNYLLTRAVQLVLKSGAVKKSLEYADDLVEKAWAKMEKELPKNKNLEAFKEITYFLLKRTH